MRGLVTVAAPTILDGLGDLIANTTGLPTSFHNGPGCDVVTASGKVGWCREHELSVYRDGIDWLTLPVTAVKP